MPTPNESILVSIQCLVFNHEPFLRRCLDGFVMQKTDFCYEAIVHDDASSDNSANIIREYAEKYPEIIKPIFETENQFSKHDGSLGRIIQKEFRGKYIALCEGDDFWTDPLKLQKQVDYLESHPDCTLCFGNALEHWEDGSQTDHVFAALETRDYSGVENCWKWIIPTATIVYRKEIIQTDLYNKVKTNRKFPVGDLPLILTCATYGKMHAYSDIYATYRKHIQGFTMNYDSSLHMKMGLMWNEIPLIFGKSYQEVSVYKAIQHFRKGIGAAKIERNNKRLIQFVFYILLMYIIHPVNSGKRFVKVIQQRRQNQFQSKGL